MIKLCRGTWGGETSVASRGSHSVHTQPGSTNVTVSSGLSIYGLTFQRLVDVVIQVVNPQAVCEASLVLLDTVRHHIDRHSRVVLLHLTVIMSQLIKAP